MDLECGVSEETQRDLENVRGFYKLEQGLPKDSYPLPKFDKLVDATAEHALLSFIDAFSGYHRSPSTRKIIKRLHSSRTTVSTVIR